KTTIGGPVCVAGSTEQGTGPDRMVLLRPCSDSPEMSRMAGLALCTQGSGRLPLSARVCAPILWCFPCRDLTCTQNGWGTRSHCFSLYWAQTVPLHVGLFNASYEQITTRRMQWVSASL